MKVTYERLERPPMTITITLSEFEARAIVDEGAHSDAVLTAGPHFTRMLQRQLADALRDA